MESKQVKYVEHFLRECLIHYHNIMLLLYNFIYAAECNKECEIMRKDLVTSSISKHNYDNDLVSTKRKKTWQRVCQVDVCTLPYVWAWITESVLFLFRGLSQAVASLIGFCCLCRCENHTLSVSTGDRVQASRQYKPPHMKRHAETHVRSLRTEDNTHRNLDGSDTNKHAQLAD